MTFLFGIDARPNLKAIAEDLAATDWSELQRPPQYEAQGKPRKRPEKVQGRIVRERGFRSECDPAYRDEHGSSAIREPRYWGQSRPRQS